MDLPQMGNWATQCQGRLSSQIPRRFARLIVIDLRPIKALVKAYGDV